MRVLYVARSKNGKYAPFITEQVNAICKEGVETRVYGISRGGINGYLHNLIEINRVIDSFRPDLIHAHYGLCGVISNLQRKIPVITTYHGSDINDPKILPYSKWSIRKSAFNIFVSQKNIDIARPKGHYELIPCGIDLQEYPLVEKFEARKELGLDNNDKYVLFGSAFDNEVKNAPLAKESMSLLSRVNLLEMKGYTRSQVSLLMQAVDSLLLTSFTEGSPQVVKEAMACGCPIVSVDVGDVKEQIDGVEGCYIADRKPESIATCLRKAIYYNKRTPGRDVIIEKGLTNDTIASRIISIYSMLIHS